MMEVDGAILAVNDGIGYHNQGSVSGFGFNGCLDLLTQHDMKVRGVVYVHVPVCENSPFGLSNMILYYSSFCTVLYYSILQQQNVLLRALFDTNVFLPNTKIPTLPI